MDASVSTPAASTNTDVGTSRPRHNARRGRGRGQSRGGESASSRLRPASIVPPTANQDSDASANGALRARRGRGRGRGVSGAPGGRERAVDTRTVNGRTFGGQLTREETNTSEISQGEGSLQGNAPIFVPGQQHVQNVQQTRPTQKLARPPRQPKRRASKSHAPDIATRTHEDIDNGYYECAICTSEVRRNSKVWSCHTCWTVFHLHCIKKWCSNEGSGVSQQSAQNGELPPLRQWRCPGCNLPKSELPGSYVCWCEKELDPKPPAGIPPHSCGQTCGKERVKKCPHPCQLTCHAGPCPPCTHMGPTQACFCGKHDSTKRCSETDYTSGWGCGEICGAIMACGIHYCPRPCHQGSCGSCEVRLPARCYCGQMEKDVLCSDEGEKKESLLTHKSESGDLIRETWTGLFDCGNACDQLFDCGVHRCQKPCHPQNLKSGHCPYSPDVVTHCPCGKTLLSKITAAKRQICEDAIPNCSEACAKPLACGHPCPAVCHSGDCPPCKQTVIISCRCGRTSSKTMCHQGNEEQPQCRRVCRTNLNCGRHMCEEHCCAGERQALERQAARRKQRPLGSAPRAADDGFESEHICTRQCGRPLKCGNHFCEELCHKGPCGTCREAIFDEISCACGRTVLQPPLPCGTQPPACRQPCERVKACGHPQVSHTCHSGSESCPRCVFLTEKRCMCGRKALKNQQCWLRDVSCGEVCGKKLKCGFHFCRKPCHRPGMCEDANGESCKQPCGKEKKVCGHPDEDPCHAPFGCREEKACIHRIFITCSCQAQKQEMRCGASKSSEGNNDKSLPCNEECARLERNRKLALALNIDQSTHVEGGDHIPFCNETLSLFAQNMKWAQTQEREFRVFADADDEKRLRFKPMQAQQRAFVHSLAEDFGLDSESVDPEPHRHVMVWKTPRFVSAPNKTLADALRLRQQAQRSANVSANVSDNESAPSKPKTKTLEPYNSFRIMNPRFGLTVEEVRVEVNKVLHPITPFTLNIEFLPSDEIVLKAVSCTLPALDLEHLLQNLKTSLATVIAGKGYGSTQLCTTDSSLNITRYESDTAGHGDGWSKVAAKKSAPRVNVPAVGISATPNLFSHLSGGKVTFARKKPERKPKAAPIVDDWEAAELEEEEKERVASASDDDGGVKTELPETGTNEEAALGSSERRDWAAEVDESMPLT